LFSKSVAKRNKAPHAPRFPREIAVGREANWLQTGRETVKTGRNWHETRQKWERFNPQPAARNPVSRGQSHFCRHKNRDSPRLMHQPFQRGGTCETRSTMRKLLAFNTLQRRTTHAPVTEKSQGRCISPATAGCRPLTCPQKSCHTGCKLCFAQLHPVV